VEVGLVDQLVAVVERVDFLLLLEQPLVVVQIKPSLPLPQQLMEL
jgi:hypothetical protein